MADMEGMGGMHGGMEGLRAGLCRLPEGRSADRRVGRWAEKAGGRLPLLRCLTTLQTPFGTHQGKTLAILIIPDRPLGAEKQITSLRIVCSGMKWKLPVVSKDWVHACFRLPEKNFLMGESKNFTEEPS